MKRYLPLPVLLLSSIFLLNYCVTVPAKSIDAGIYNTLEIGKSNKTDVLKALGEPLQVNHHPDGRSLYLYTTTENKILSLVFDQQDQLIRRLEFDKSKQ